MLSLYRPGRLPGVLCDTQKIILHRRLPLIRRSYVQTSDLSMTKVEKIILDNIKTTGPISFASYMQLCLCHPTEGYYMSPSNPVFGPSGDFTTSPEISQVFGELLGVWLLSQWMNSGAASDICLVELGPGRGTLMDDIIRVLFRFPTSQKALKQIHLVENSPKMRAIQKEKLLQTANKGNLEVIWHDSLDDVPRNTGAYTMLIAHEFFDALPIHVIQKTHQGWREVLVSSTNMEPSMIVKNPGASPSISSLSTQSSHSRLRRVLSPSTTPSSTLLGLSSRRFEKLPMGAQLEVSPAAFKIAHKVGEVLQGPGDQQGHGGCALIVDYGAEKAFGDSLRAFKDHKVVDIFHRPGECDLTANVDFSYIKESVADLVSTYGTLSQATFLNRMGLAVRVEALKRNARSRERNIEIENGAKRLVDLTGMGREYRVLGLGTLRGCVDKDAKPANTWPFVDVQSDLEP